MIMINVDLAFNLSIMAPFIFIFILLRFRYKDRKLIIIIIVKRSVPKACVCSQIDRFSRQVKPLIAG